MFSRFRILCLLCLICAFMIALPLSSSAFEESFDNADHSQVMAGILHYGQDGPWTGALVDGRYVLINTTDPGAVRYYYLVSQPDGSGPLPKGASASVEVEVSSPGSMDPELIAGAGLIYAFDQQKRHYVAFTLLNDETYAFFVRDDGGFQQRLGGSHGAIKAEGANILAIEPNNEHGLDLKINGERIASYGGSALSDNGIGLLGLGTGRFAFDNFTITTE